MKYLLSNTLMIISCLILLLLVGDTTAVGECNGKDLLCQEGYCCSTSGYCGYTDAYCGPGHCASQCPSPPPPSPPPPPFTPPPPISPDDVSTIITESLYNEMLLHRNSVEYGCEGGFYTYDAFLSAARHFKEFGTTGSLEQRKRELAAFFGQTSHETTGGWDTAPDGPYTWGYCFITERDKSDPHCQSSAQWPCVPGKYYYGRGPIQLSYNYNYGQAGEYFGLDLLSHPELVETDAVLSFETAIWFWMTPQGNKPSSHDVIVDAWTPTPPDIAAGRLPGYGVITNIINGGLECGKPNDKDAVSKVIQRIRFYERYCELLEVNPGDNLDCFNQQPFGNALVNVNNPGFGSLLKMPIDKA